MIVRCITREADFDGIPDRDPRFEEPRPLTVGRQYTVYAIALTREGLWFYVLDDDELRWPIRQPASLFELESGRFPAGWVLGRHRNANNNELYTTISFPEWATEPFYYERLLDDDPEATEVFRSRRIEAESIM